MVVPYQLVPSEKNEKISCLEAVPVIVGAVAEGQLTVVHVTDREPVASWRKIITNDLPATAVGIVMVAFAVNVKT